MEEFYLPTLLSFANGNTFTGSHGLLRYRIEPKIVELNKKEVNMAESSIFAELWHGLLCYELSEIEDSATFPMSEEGRGAIRQWLMDHV